jgi:type II secretory pathway pseudopilin PulG
LARKINTSHLFSLAFLVISKRMNLIKKIKKKDGFSLIELVVYIGIFAAASVFMVGILIIFTRINLRQTAINEVNDQVYFVNSTVQRLVKDSSFIDMTAGSATSTLNLRMASSTLSPTKVYLENGIVYLKEGDFSPITLTDTNVTVNDFQVTKYENPGGHSLVRVYMTVSYNTSNEQAKFKRTVNTAISRVSAATFDSSILPNADDSYDIGNASKNWKDAYFSGNVGIGTAPVSSAALKSSGDISISDSDKGLILKSPGGTCYRITVLNGGNTTSTAVTCP